MVLTFEEAAAIAGCSVLTLKAGLKSGRYVGMKNGRSWTIMREAFIEGLNKLAAEESLKRREPPKQRVIPASRKRRRGPLLTLP